MDENLVHKRAKTILQQVFAKDSHCRIEESENGEIVIYTGLVKIGKKYRSAKPREQMDYVPEDKLEIVGK